MGSNRRSRDRRPARGTATRSPKRRLLIVCEGRVTEPEYFRGFERWARNASVEIDIPNQHGVPLTLVEYAARRKLEADDGAERQSDAFLAYDEVWCVFDVDEHPNLDQARALANGRGIELAVSNPCFELWLLLHFRENPGARHRHKVQAMVRELISGYDKHLEFEQLAAGIDDATRRARRLQNDADAEGESTRNPTTTVYRLTDSMLRRGDG